MGITLNKTNNKIFFDGDDSFFKSYDDFLKHTSSSGDIIAEANNSWIAERYSKEIKDMGYDIIKFKDGGTDCFLTLNKNFIKLKTNENNSQNFIKSNSGIDRFFKNQKKLNKLPTVLYHLTAANTLDDIKKNGLLIKHSKQHHFENGIYLTDDLYTAVNYKYLDDNKENYAIIEIPFKNLSTKFMKPDDYEIFDLLDDGYSKLLKYLGVDIDEVHQNSKYIWDELDFRHSLYICNQIIYTANITPDKFSNILSEKDVKKKLKL